MLQMQEQQQTCPNTTTSLAVFKLSQHQLNQLKAKCSEGSNIASFSSFEVIEGHVWCCCMHEASRMTRVEDVYNHRWSIMSTSSIPPPPVLGHNAILHVTPIAAFGDLVLKPLNYAVKKVHCPLVQVYEGYIRSAINYVELQPDSHALKRGPHTLRCPNLGFTSWCRMPIQDAYFGWGRPMFMGLGIILYEGLAYVLPSIPIKEGSLCLVISLPSDHLTIQDVSL